MNINSPVLLFLSLVIIIPGCGNLTTESPKSSSKEITSFSLSSPDTTAIIVDSLQTITVNVPFGTAVTALTPTITHTGASIDPASGTVQDFSRPVPYTVTDTGNATKVYTVTVIVGLDTAKAISSFTLSNPDTTAVIVDSTRTIIVNVPFGTAVTALTPTITHTGASIDPVSGTARDFTSPVTYTVTAADGSTRAYRVSAKVNAITDSLKILFIGNSITYHEPRPDVGWYGDWGMAASCIENDYVHVLMTKLASFIKNTTFDTLLVTVVSWEQDFSIEYYGHLGMYYHPDICIIRLGENVNEEYARNNSYYAQLTYLVKLCIDSSTKVIITGNVFPSSYKDSIQQAVALDNGWHYVDLQHFSANPANYAYGLFTDEAVASHPSDAGMMEIATSIYLKIQEILFNQSNY